MAIDELDLGGVTFTCGEATGGGISVAVWHLNRLDREEPVSANLKDEDLPRLLAFLRDNAPRKAVSADDPTEVDPDVRWMLLWAEKMAEAASNQKFPPHVSEEDQQAMIAHQLETAERLVRVAQRLGELLLKEREK